MNRTARAVEQATSGLRVMMLAAAGLAAAPLAASAGTEIFDFEVPNQTARPEVVPAPVLNDSNVAAVDAFLQGRAGQTRALKVFTELTNPAAIDLFNKYQVDYLFADYEGGDAAEHTRNLANQLDNTSSWGSLKYGNFDFRAGDSKTNMHNLNLYPGSPIMANLSGPGSSSNDEVNSPNIRSALFAAPIQRFADLTNKRLQHTNIPYVSRFNNWGNADLDTDGNASNGYQFVTSDQLLSRGDFSAQVLHYRMRGADSVHLFQPGVVGYTKQEMQDDAIAGWNLPQVQEVFDAGDDVQHAYLAEEVGVGPRRDAQDLTDGVVLSGAYTEKDKLFVLLSNLTDEDRDDIRFDEVDKLDVEEDDYQAFVAANSHVLFEFDYVKEGKKAWWDLVSFTEVFADDDREGVGIPEPAAVGLLALAAPLLARRRRAAHGG